MSETDELRGIVEDFEDLELNASVHRRLAYLTRSAEFGCLSDQIYVAQQWLAPLAAMARTMAPLPDPTNYAPENLDHMVGHLEQMASELGARGFFPPQIDYISDPLGYFAGWAAYFDRVAGHVWSAPQADVDGLIAMVTVKH